MPKAARDEVKKLLIDLIRSDPEVHAALRAWEHEEARLAAPHVARETSKELERIIRSKEWRI